MKQPTSMSTVAICAAGIAAPPKQRQSTARLVRPFSIATKTSYIKDGDRQERTEWHRVQVWGRLGEYASAFQKGSHICVECELRGQEYESQGAKVRTYDLVANSIINLRAGQATQPRRPILPKAAA